MEDSVAEAMRCARRGVRGFDIANRPDKDQRPEFQAPGNIVFVPVDKATGSVTNAETPGAIGEAFIAGTQPGGLNRLP